MVISYFTLLLYALTERLSSLNQHLAPTGALILPFLKIK